MLLLGDIIERAYVNPNGFYTEEELLEMKHMTEEAFRKFISSNTGKLKCPPRKYAIVSCFYCIDCIKQSLKLIKEKKVE